MEMMRKLPKKSDNYGIPYIMVNEVRINERFTEQLVYDSNYNYIRNEIFKNNPEDEDV